MKDKDGKQTGNRVVSVRLSKECDYALGEGIIYTGLSQPSYIRLAIIEKAERDRNLKK